jgi:hypothetical protein
LSGIQIPQNHALLDNRGAVALLQNGGADRAVGFGLVRAKSNVNKINVNVNKVKVNVKD